MLALLGSLKKATATGNVATNSLRFRASNSAYLSRTFATPTGATKWSLSLWLKRGSINSDQYLIEAFSDLSNRSALTINAQNSLGIYFIQAASVVYQTIWNPVLRDCSAWYHILIVQDTSLDESNELNRRMKLYINGVQQSSSVNTPLPLGSNGHYIHQAFAHGIGRYNGNSNYFDGYLTEAYLIDGQALTPSSFGQINSTTGVWQPKQYTGTYGTNGFALEFADASAATAAAIGKDTSGNGNNWTPSGISVTAGATYDSMLDVPNNYADGGNGRGNYATLSPLTLGTNCSLTNGNLDASWSGVALRVNTQSNFGIPASGKWYWEVTLASNTNGNATFGIVGTGYSPTAGDVGDPTSGYALAPGLGGSTIITKKNNNISSSWGAATTNFGAGIIYGIAVNMDIGSIFFRDATGWMNASNSSDLSPTTAAFTGLSGTYVPAIGHYSIGAQSTAFNLNFGQRPFTYTPPTGFLALNTQNLPTPAIANGASVMAATTYTGTGSALTITNTNNNVSFQPDFVWLKGRSGATDHALYDVVRGTTKDLVSNTAAAETTQATGLTAFNADGFNLGALAKLNTAAATYIAWQWKAGGAAVSNTAGTITSQVSANQTAGFSIVTYTGNNTSGATVGHGLGVAPKMVIVKNRSVITDWPVYHSSLSASNVFWLNLTNNAQSISTTTQGGISSTSSTVFTCTNGTANGNAVNGNTNLMVAYCFAEIAGFSKFGSYTGNGSADGPFVYCGFRPKFVMIKCSSTAGGSWVMYDSGRDQSNLSSAKLAANLAEIENGATVGNSTLGIDLLSNGFKNRNDGGVNHNSTGATYIFAAFAENPSKYALAR